MYSTYMYIQINSLCAYICLVKNCIQNYRSVSDFICSQRNTFSTVLLPIICIIYSLADCMRGMEFDAWLAMMEHLFNSLLNHLKTVQVCNT